MTFRFSVKLRKYEVKVLNRQVLRMKRVRLRLKTRIYLEAENSFGSVD